MGSPWLGKVVSPALSEPLVELRVFDDADVEVLCPTPEEDETVWSIGDVGELGSCSLVFFFFRNPKVGIELRRG